jgi:crossover junction endodeoxyribonuclease RusA
MFEAYGVAAPQGCKDQFGRESSKRLRPWRASVAHMAGIAMLDKGDPFEGPVELQLYFAFTRPKKHFRANGQLRDDAPRYVTSKGVGDIDKLVRAVADALTGIVYLDDSQIAVLSASKTYGTRAGVNILAVER